MRGGEDLLRRLVRLAKFPSRATAERMVLEGAQIIVEEARRLVPVRSGRLRDSITAQAGEASGAAVGARSRGVSVSIGPSLPKGWYGHFIEFGTVDTPAQPFMRPAFDARQREVERKLAAEVKIEVRRATGG